MISAAVVTRPAIAVSEPVVRSTIATRSFSDGKGRQDEERLVERIALAGDGDLVLLHRLEQARLGLGRRAIDLVGQDQVGEHGPRLEPEQPATALLDEDVGAGDVGGHEVRGELDPVEAAVDDVGDRADEQRLAQAGDALQERVAVGEEACQRLADQIPLADDDAPHLCLDRPGALGELLRRELLCGGRALRRHWCSSVTAWDRAS